MYEYRAQLQALHKTLLSIKQPAVSNPETSTYAEKSYDFFLNGLVLEMEKTDLMIDGMNSGNLADQEDFKNRNAEINKNNMLAVLYMQRIFWNYGYDSSDLSELTMNVKPGIMPKDTSTFNRNAER